MSGLLPLKIKLRLMALYCNEISTKIVKPIVHILNQGDASEFLAKDLFSSTGKGGSLDTSMVTAVHKAVPKF